MPREDMRESSSKAVEKEGTDTMEVPQWSYLFHKPLGSPMCSRDLTSLVYVMFSVISQCWKHLRRQGMDTDNHGRNGGVLRRRFILSSVQLV